MSLSGDYLDTITSRGGRNSGITFLGNFDIKILMVDPSFPLPPEFYEYNRLVDKVYIGSHFGFEFQLDFYYVLKGSAVPPNVGFWRWTVLCDVKIVYPDGYIKSQTVSLGTELVDPAIEDYKEVAFPISFSSTSVFNPDKRVTLTEDASYFYHPPFTTLDLYEEIPTTTVESLSVTVTGLDSATVTENAHALTVNATTEYNYTITTDLHSKGSTAGVQPLQISNLTLNELIIPDYTYLHVINSNNYFYQTTSVDAKIQGTDDAFGVSVENQISASTNVTLERNIKNKGIINSWQSSYPDALDVDIAKFDITGRTITVPGGSFDESETYQKYSFNSTITIAGTGNTQSLIFNNLPTGYIQNTIDSASLVANGDYADAVRLPFRGWWKPGADIYHSKNTVLSGVGNTRNVDYNFSGYRYLDITGASTTASDETAKFTVSWDGIDVILEKDLIFSPGSQTKRIDLCFGGIAHTLFPDIQGQDNPYPRVNYIFGNTVGAVQYNSDMFGIGQVKKIQTTGNVNISEYKLTREDNTGKASFIAPFSTGQTAAGTSSNGFSNWQTDSPTRSFWSRRFWEQDVSGKNEEEFDYGFEYLLTSGIAASQYAISVQVLCDNINDRRDINNVKIHTGWLASPSYDSGAVGTNESLFNKDAAYCSWLNGFGQQCIAGISDFSILRDLSEEYGSRDIYTQLIFDRLNCNYPPDYYDPFQLEAPGETDLLLYSFSCLRSAAHGLVQESLLGQVVNLEDTSANIWGQGTTDIVGSYQTGLPGGLPENAGRIGYVTGIIPITKVFTAKRDRGSFYLNIPTTGNILSADISGFYQHLIGFSNAGTLNLILSDSFNFSTFIYLVTNVTSITNGAVRWKRKTSDNQIIATVEESSGSVKRYEFDNLITGVAGMATTLGTGTQPALAINNNGFELHFFRTTDAGGSIKRVGIDNNGDIIIPASIVVSGNVTTNGLAAYWYDDIPYLVYSHATNGITVVKSDDYGNTFS